MLEILRYIKKEINSLFVKEYTKALSSPENSCRLMSPTRWLCAQSDGGELEASYLYDDEAAPCLLHN